MAISNRHHPTATSISISARPFTTRSSSARRILDSKSTTLPSAILRCWFRSREPWCFSVPRCRASSYGGVVRHSNIAVRSVRARHPQHVLADIGEDQIGRDRGGLVEAHLAPLALDVVLAGKGEAAIGGERRLGGMPGRFRS